MAKLPPKLIMPSASLLLFREEKDLSFKILLLKRSPNISLGGFYAFPGGMIEKQD